MKKTLLVILLLIISLLFVDLSNLDAFLYKVICQNFSFFSFNVICPDFYDLPIWNLFSTVGTLAAIIFACKGIEESNKRLSIEQTPYVVFSDRIITSGLTDRLHVISLKNIGRGSAIHVVATADPTGKISIIEGSNPHSIDLDRGQVCNNWAIDEDQVIKGLKAQNISVSSVLKDIPDENTLNDDQKSLADFCLYFWYEDQLGSKYKTTGKFRHASFFLKVMENKVEKL